MMFLTCRRSAIALFVLILCSVVAVFTLHEGAQSALDSGIRHAHENLHKHFGKGDSDGGTDGSVDSSAENSVKNTVENTDEKSDGFTRVIDQEIGHENATFFTLCRNDDLRSMLAAVKSVELKFNSRFKYDWVFLNDEEFTSEFKSTISEATSGETHFGTLNETMWGYPEWIDAGRAAETRAWMKENNVPYGDMESYHHMCRFQAGYFFRHPLMMKYKYAWRVEPGISILCKQKIDPFRLMRVNELVYGFNIAPQDIPQTITTLWNSTKKFLAERSNLVNPDSLRDFLSDDGGETYNTCHFWTNFEISDMDWLRSDTYLDYFEFLDHEGGFYYERWGDAPIRSIAASLFLPKDKIYFFNDIGYYHEPFGHCPYNQGPSELECDCQPRPYDVTNVFYDFHKNSCMRRYFRAKGRSFYDPAPEQTE